MAQAGCFANDNDDDDDKGICEYEKRLEVTLLGKGVTH
jgi:hypothetical protein